MSAYRRILPRAYVTMPDSGNVQGYAEYLPLVIARV